MVGLKSDHRSIVTDKVRQVVGLSFDGHFVYWTNVALNTESIVKARQDGTKMEVRKIFCFAQHSMENSKFHYLFTDFINNGSDVARRYSR